MSKIIELILKFCPDGVENKELGEICDFRNGFAFKSSRFKTEGSPILRIGNIQNRIVDLNNLVFFDIEEYNEDLTPFEIRNGDVLIAMSGATTGKIGYLNSDEVFYLNQRVGKFEPHTNKLNNRFLYHYLITKSNELYVLAGGGAQPNLSSTTLMKRITIPLPPLPIQQEIVSILDKFTTLEAELEAELEARRAQYNHYRDKLLCFEGKEVEWKIIKDLFDFKNGLNKGKEFFGKGTPIVNFTDVFKKRSLTRDDLKGTVDVTSKEKYLYSAQKNDVFFTRTSETQEEIGMVSALLDDVEDCVFSGFVLRARPKTNLLNPKFCSYYLNSNTARKEIIRSSTYTTRALTSGPRLSKIKIPIPPIAEQERIVGILDKFDALVNDISAGLPAEIEARRKQYEYYRSKLLSFKPVVMD